MKIVVNGAPREVADGATVASVVAEVSPTVSGVAVALNEEVVRRVLWDETRLREADRIEVLTAVQGG
jgi:sulfur carrier protein